MANDAPICKYCLEELENETVLQPCLCKDYVHRKCLEKWLEKKRDFSNCEICQGKYQRKLVGINWNFIIWKLTPILLDIFLLLGFNDCLDCKDNPENEECEIIIDSSMTVFILLFLIALPFVAHDNQRPVIDSRHIFFKYVKKYSHMVPIFTLINQVIGITYFYMKFGKMMFNIQTFCIGLILLIGNSLKAVGAVIIALCSLFALFLMIFLMNFCFFYAIKVCNDIRQINLQEVSQKYIQKILHSVKEGALAFFEATFGYYFLKYDYPDVRIVTMKINHQPID